MSLRLEVVCDKCGEPSCLGNERFEQLPLSARELAKRIGWKYKDGKDTCHNCIRLSRSIAV